MNILILANHLNAGGISRYVINLSKGLKERGHSVWVACDKGEWLGLLRDAGINYKYIPIRFKALAHPKVFVSFFMLWDLIRRQNIGIVHANTRVTQFLAYLINKFLKVPYVVSIHGFVKATFVKKLFKLCGLRTIAVSKSVKDYAVKKLNLKEENLRVVYNGIDDRLFCSQKASRADYGFSPGDFLIGLLGRISEEKGHFLAVEAFNSIYRAHPRAYLLIKGEGRLKDELTAFIAKAGCKDRVRFLSLPAPAFLSLLDVLAVPSYKEGFGYAVLEAFLAEVAVVGFNTGGISELIKDGHNGILFNEYKSYPLKQAIEKLIIDEKLRKSIAEEGRKSCVMFSLERMAVCTEEVYREIIS